MAQFLVKAKSGIRLFEQDKEGNAVRKHVKAGEVVELSAEQCELYAAKGEKLPGVAKQAQKQESKPDKK